MTVEEQKTLYEFLWLLLKEQPMLIWYGGITLVLLIMKKRNRRKLERHRESEFRQAGWVDDHERLRVRVIADKALLRGWLMFSTISVSLAVLAGALETTRFFVWLCGLWTFLYIREIITLVLSYFTI